MEGPPSPPKDGREATDCIPNDDSTIPPPLPSLRSSRSLELLPSESLKDLADAAAVPPSLNAAKSLELEPPSLQSRARPRPIMTTKNNKKKRPRNGFTPITRPLKDTSLGDLKKGGAIPPPPPPPPPGLLNYQSVGVTVSEPLNERTSDPNIGAILPPSLFPMSFSLGTATTGSVPPPPPSDLRGTQSLGPGPSSSLGSGSNSSSGAAAGRRARRKNKAGLAQRAKKGLGYPSSKVGAMPVKRSSTEKTMKGKGAGAAMAVKKSSSHDGTSTTPLGRRQQNNLLLDDDDDNDSSEGSSRVGFVAVHGTYPGKSETKGHGDTQQQQRQQQQNTSTDAKPGHREGKQQANLSPHASFNDDSSMMTSTTVGEFNDSTLGRRRRMGHYGVGHKNDSNATSSLSDDDESSVGKGVKVRSVYRSYSDDGTSCQGHQRYVRGGNNPLAETFPGRGQRRRGRKRQTNVVSFGSSNHDSSSLDGTRVGAVSVPRSYSDDGTSQGYRFAREKAKLAQTYPGLRRGGKRQTKVSSAISKDYTATVSSRVATVSTSGTSSDDSAKHDSKGLQLKEEFAETDQGKGVLGSKPDLVSSSSSSDGNDDDDDDDGESLVESLRIGDLPVRRSYSDDATSGGPPSLRGKHKLPENHPRLAGIRRKSYLSASSATDDSSVGSSTVGAVSVNGPSLDSSKSGGGRGLRRNNNHADTSPGRRTGRPKSDFDTSVGHSSLNGSTASHDGFLGLRGQGSNLPPLSLGSSSHEQKAGRAVSCKGRGLGKNDAPNKKTPAFSNSTTPPADLPGKTDRAYLLGNSPPEENEGKAVPCAGHGKEKNGTTTMSPEPLEDVAGPRSEKLNKIKSGRFSVCGFPSQHTEITADTSFSGETSPFSTEAPPKKVVESRDRPHLKEDVYDPFSQKSNTITMTAEMARESAPSLGDMEDMEITVDHFMDEMDPESHGLVEARPVTGRSVMGIMQPEGAVEVVSQEREEAFRRMRRIRLLRSLACLCLFMVLLVIIALFSGGVFNSEPSIAGPVLPETEAPSSSPTMDPTPYLLPLPESTIWTIEEDSYSPQSLAYLWMIYDPLLESYSESRLLQRFALATFYFANGGDDWVINDRWLSYEQNGNECDWHSKSNRYACDADGNYIALVMTKNGLSGSLPPELHFLSHLEVIDFASNSIKGRIPTQIGLLTRLKELVLDVNQLTGELPSEIGHLSELELFFVHTNPLTGSLPTQLGSLTRMVDLEMSNALFTGQIPSVLGRLTQATSLHLEFNVLEGAISSELFLMTTLSQALRLDGNYLKSQLPSEVGLLTNLDMFAIDSNDLSGVLPTEIGAMKNLTRLYLYGNNLNGTLPHEMGHLDLMEQIHLYDNRFSGPLPSEVALMTNLYDLDFEDNLLSSSIPLELFQNLQEIEYILLRSNKLTGTIPSDIGNMNKLKDLLLSSNQISGPIPSELAAIPQLEYLLISDTLLSGEIPTELANLSTTLEILYIEETLVSGTIPPDLCGIPELNFTCSDTLCGCYCICLSTHSSKLLP